MTTITGILIGYFVGSISFCVLTAKIFKVDLSSIGSGNLGATNLSRAVGWKIAIVPAVLDAVKTVIVFLLCNKLLKLDVQTTMLAGVFAVIGHIFPWWNKLKGGKGVASFIGFAFCTQNFWIPFWLCMLMIYINKKLKLMILATLIVTTSILIGSAFSNSSIIFSFAKGSALYYTIFLYIIVMIKHIGNFQRWMSGTENSSGK